MSVSSISMSGISAYQDALKQANRLISAPKVAEAARISLPEEQVNFSVLAGQYMEKFKQKVTVAERQTVQGTVRPGAASTQELVTAIAEAELFVQQTKMIHEKIILAFQDLYKTPI